MSAQGFKSVYMAASVVGAALGCYLVSLNVASERAKLEAVEEQIVLTQRDIRVLQTEIGTRGRLAQLERWNARFIRLAAPSADQFVEGGFQLAALVRPDRRPAIEAPVVLAAAPALAPQVVTNDGDDTPRPSVATPSDAADLLRTASYERPAALAAKKPAEPATAKRGLAVAKKPSKQAVLSVAKAADPLAPLPTASAPGAGGAPKSLPGKPKDRSTAQ
jgi:hypothetical protein